MLGLPGDFHVRRCARCGLLFQNPVPSPAALARHYPDSYAPYSAPEMRIGPAAVRELRRRGYAHLDAPPGFALPLWDSLQGRYDVDTLLLPDFVPGGRLLEIACASGTRLSLLRRLGWTCEGIEFSETAAQAARDRGFKVRTGRVEDLLSRVPDASLDALVAGFVLEHLQDPFAVARLVAAKLKPGGQFLFSTLDVASPDFRLYGKYWYNLDLPRHLVFFQKRDFLYLSHPFFRMERLTRIAAPNDYARSAAYRARHGRAPAPVRVFDRLLMLCGDRLQPLCRLLAGAGLASRVAVRFRRLG